jgi:putative CocE/NonD family hydrolase
MRVHNLFKAIALKRVRPLTIIALVFAGPLVSQAPLYPNYPSETPARFQPSTSAFDYTKRDEMIAMRDGVKLHAVILIPKGAKSAPILLGRTPYNAGARTSAMPSTHLAEVMGSGGYDLAGTGEYIFVVEDVRGKYGSEGDYVMTRPLHGPLNPTPVDHATDTWDTIDWLVKNIPETNGKVGILGISYGGFTPLMALVNPHPALKVSVPMNPMVDGWMGDDWFHNGAFRQLMIPYIYEQQATRANSERWWSGHFDDYDEYREAGSAGEIAQRHGMEQIGFWRRLLDHPAYDAYWRDQAMDKVLAAQPLKVPVMLVHSLWDQEDIYGAIAVYKALKPLDKNNDKVFLTIGPWHHGQESGEGSALGAIKFHSDTSLYFRQNVLRPFLDRYLKDSAPAAKIAAVTAFETGTNSWQSLAQWPVPSTPKRLYLAESGKTGFTPPQPGGAAYSEYISDPAKPVPFRTRPNSAISADGSTWRQWLVDDQREASGRTDVAVFTSDVLRDPVKIGGQPLVNLMASTSGTDSDWVVKLIDVYPEEVPRDAAMGGYQLMVAADIFRGRYRESLETPKAIVSGQQLLYKFALPTANHVFLPGHRIMVQVQSSWFPLYDRNPQKFVPNIFWAKPEDYIKATQRIYTTSFIELPVE